MAKAAASAALIQPRVGRARDAGRLGDRTGMTVGLALTAAGTAIATVMPGIAGILMAAVIIGAGTGLITRSDDPIMGGGCGLAPSREV